MRSIGASADHKSHSNRLNRGLGWRVALTGSVVAPELMVVRWEAADATDCTAKGTDESLGIFHPSCYGEGEDQKFFNSHACLQPLAYSMSKVSHSLMVDSLLWV